MGIHRYLKCTRVFLELFRVTLFGLKISRGPRHLVKLFAALGPLFRVIVA